MSKQSSASETPKRPAHHKSEEEEKQEREENMDRTLADSFPASDPPSSIPDPEDEDQDSAA
jgi:hypothetical protein